jgi:hypothetical protein
MHIFMIDDYIQMHIFMIDDWNNTTVKNYKKSNKLNLLFLS